MFNCQQLADSCIASRNRHAFTDGQFPGIEFLCPEIHGFAPCFDKANENGMTCWLSPSHIWISEDQFESPLAGSALATNSAKRMKPKYLWKYFEIFWNHDITRHAMIIQGHRLKFNANWATWHGAESKVAERITVHEKNDNASTNSSQLWQFLSKVVASLLSHVSCSSGFDLRSQYFPHIDTVVAFQGTIWVCPKLQEVEKKLYEIVEMVLSSFLRIIQHYSTSFEMKFLRYPVRILSAGSHRWQSVADCLGCSNAFVSIPHVALGRCLGTALAKVSKDRVSWRILMFHIWNFSFKSPGSSTASSCFFCCEVPIVHRGRSSSRHSDYRSIHNLSIQGNGCHKLDTSSDFSLSSNAEWGIRSENLKWWSSPQSTPFPIVPVAASLISCDHGFR